MSDASLENEEPDLPAASHSLASRVSAIYGRAFSSPEVMSALNEDTSLSTVPAPSNASTTSKSSCEDTESDHGMVDHASFMLLTSDGSRVLMVQENQSWILPPFTHYHDEYDMDECCLALQNALDIPEQDETVFTIAAELLGEFAFYDPDAPEDYGYAKLFMVEPHLDPVPIPKQYDWKDSSFLSTILAQTNEMHYYHPVLEHTMNYMTPRRDKALAKISDPRNLFGWFATVSRWVQTVLLSVGASPIGRLQQVQVTHGSTILKQNSSQGYFYVKAAALGGNEMSICTALTEVMPHRVLNAVASSEKLRCFVTRAFEEGGVFSESVLLNAVENLAMFHLESIQHVDYLRNAGCPDRSPQYISETLQKWSTDERYSPIFGTRIEKFRSIVTTLQELCATLSASQVPLTLVHGDYGEHNIAYSDPGRKAPIAYDFESACVSHPFCDMHVLDNQFFFDEEEHNMNEQRWAKRARAVYLAHFSKYCSNEATLRDEYRAALVLSKIIMMPLSLERMLECDFQVHSAHRDEFIFLFDWAASNIERLGLGS